MSKIHIQIWKCLTRPCYWSSHICWVLWTQQYSYRKDWRNGERWKSVIFLHRYKIFIFSSIFQCPTSHRFCLSFVWISFGVLTYCSCVRQIQCAKSVAWVSRFTFRYYPWRIPGKCGFDSLLESPAPTRPIPQELSVKMLAAQPVVIKPNIQAACEIRLVPGLFTGTSYTPSCKYVPIWAVLLRYLHKFTYLICLVISSRHEAGHPLLTGLSYRLMPILVTHLHCPQALGSREKTRPHTPLIN